MYTTVIQSTAQDSSDNLPSYIQTIIIGFIAQMLSLEGQWGGEGIEFETGLGKLREHIDPGKLLSLI